MNNEKMWAVLDVIKATATLLGVCGAILFSVDVLFGTDLFSIKKVVALAILLESTYALRSVV